MIIQRNDPAFWEVRTLERRLRRGELTQKALEEHIAQLPDVADKATASRPLEEPIERIAPRRPAVRITAVDPILLQGSQTYHASASGTEPSPGVMAIR